MSVSRRIGLHLAVGMRDRLTADARRHGSAGKLLANFRHKFCEPRRQFPEALKRLQFIRQRRIIGERHMLRIRFEEKVERIIDRHLRNQVHFDFELARLFRHHQARQEVRLRILLPVEEMLLRCDPQGKAQDFRAAVRSRTEADDLRAKLDGAIVFIGSDVVEGYVDGHGGTAPETGEFAMCKHSAGVMPTEILRCPVCPRADAHLR